MSSQNYLSNVFRQVYTYSNGQFVPSINLSNISKITADSLTVTTLSLGGANDNLYFGEGAGSLDPNSANNTAIGVEAAGSVSNVNNSVFLGRSAGLGVTSAESVIGIGVTTKGTGTSNIYIGNGTGSAADSSVSNIYIGHSIDTTSAVSNQLRIGQDGNTLLAGDFNTKWLGVGTVTPTNGYKLDVSGGANIAGNVNVTAGGNLVVAGDISAGSIRTTAISGPSIRMEGGSVGTPSYAFVSDTSLGLYDAGARSMGFANQGIQVMCISGTRVGIMTPNPATTLEVNGDVSANTYNGPDGTESAPKYTFSSDRSTGIFLDTGKLSFTVGGVKQMEVTSNGIVNTNTSAIAINKVLRDADPPVNYDISGGNIQITRTLTTSNIVGTASASNSIGGVTLSNSNVVLAGAITGSVANISNNIGGVTLSNNNIAMSGTIIGSTANTSNQIGGVTLSNRTIVDVSTVNTTYIRTGDLSSSGVYALQEFGKGALSDGTLGMPALGFNIVGSDGGYRHYLRTRHDAGDTVSNAFDFYTNNSGIAGGSSAPGVGNTLAMSVTSRGVGVGGLSVPTVALDVSGAVKASTGITGSNFTTPTASSNNIGGVILSNNIISNSGQLTTSNARIGSPPDTNVYAIEEFGGGYDNNGTGSGARPAMAFQYRSGTGGYRHFIRTRHDAQPVPAVGNAIDFFINGTATATDSSAPGTGNVLAMSATAIGVGIGTSSPAFNLDVSGNIRSTAASSNNIGGVTLSNTRIGVGVSAPTCALDTAGGGIRMATGFTGDDIPRPALTTQATATPAYEIRTNSVYGGDGFMRLHAGGNTGTYIDLTGYSVLTDMRDNLVFGNVGVERMRITPTGVGIGTKAPGTALDVSGSFRLDTSSGGSIRAFVASGTYGNLAMNGYFTVSRNNTNIGGLSNADEILTLLAADTNTTNYFMSNYVGIGMRTAYYSLDVSSATLNQGIRVTAPNAQLVLSNTGTSGIMQVFNNGANSGLFSEIPLMTFWAGGVQRMCISSTNVGIGQATPTYTLDVSSSTLFGGVRVIANGATVNLNHRGREAAGNTMQMFVNATQGGLHQFDAANTLNLMTNSTSRLAIGTNGMVAVGNGFSNPAYQLDVSAGTTAASINMTSWPRMPSSCAMMALGSLTRTSGVMNWSNASISMNTELLTFVASNASYGSYFVIKKSGIWSIKCVVTNQDTAQIATLDASTNIAFGGHIDSTGKLAQAHSWYGGDLTYVGYLSSNSGMYYKVIAPGGEQNSKNAKILITFISEMPDISPTFPPP